jgi:hypothetical protein
MTATTTRYGYRNPNGQKNLGPIRIPGTHFSQTAYVLVCTNCRYHYGTNGCDIYERKCPACQGGKEGIEVPVVSEAFYQTCINCPE